MVGLARTAAALLVALATAADSNLVPFGLAAPGLVRPSEAPAVAALDAPPPLRVETQGGEDRGARDDRPAGGMPAAQLVYPSWIDADAALEAYLAAYPAPTPVPLPTPDLTASARLAARLSAPVISNGPRTRPVVAITIDDTFRPASVRADHEFFLKERVNVTWFPVGKTIAAIGDVWRQIADAGFPIANHTWNHVDATTQSEAQIEWEINTQAAAVERYSGRPGAPFFRPMGGSWNGNVVRAAGMTGMAYVVLWDATSGDTGRGTVEDVVNNAMRARNGSIILFHANDERSDIAIRIVVANLRAKGFGFVTLGQLLGVPGPVPFPDPPAPDPSATPTPPPPPPPPFIPVPPAAPMPSPSPVPSVR